MLGAYRGRPICWTAPALTNINYIIGRPPEIKIRNRIAPWRDHSLTIDGIRPENSGSHRTCMGLFLSSGCFGFAVSSLFGAGRPFFVPSPAIRFAERAEGVKGPKR